MSTFASDSGHYYTMDGEPAYTIIGKNSKERNTTVRDARKFGLVPSVTEVMKVMAKPGLEKWKMQQVLQAALTLPMLPGEDIDAYSTLVMSDSREQGRKAMDKGTLIHGHLERYFSGQPVPEEHRDTCTLVSDELYGEFGPQFWSAEKSFACADGYGGKCDLHSPQWVVDFKTKEFTADKLPTTFDEHAMQLAAYRNGLFPACRKGPDSFLAGCAIVFVSTIAPLVHIVEISHEELKRGWAMFESALDLWKASKKYYPETIKEAAA